MNSKIHLSIVTLLVLLSLAPLTGMVAAHQSERVNPTPTPVNTPAKEWQVYTNGNYIRGIALDGGKLWAATGGGAVAWDLKTGKAEKFTVLNGLPTNDLLAVTACPIPKMRIIFGSEAGLSLYDPVTKKWEHLDRDNSNMNKTNVATLDCNPKTNTLFVGHGFGLDILDAKKNQWRYLDQQAGLATDWVSKVAVIGKETWVVSSFGLSVIGADGKITKTFTEKAKNIPDELVHGVAGDAKGNIWLAAFDGLMKYSKGQFKVYNSDAIKEFPFLDAFERVIVAKDGTVWTGNTFGTICHFDPAAERCLNIFEKKKGMVTGLNDMLLDDKNNLYYSDDNEGISMYDGKSWKSFQLTELPLGNSYEAISQLADGSILLGSALGLQKFPASDPDSKWETIDLKAGTIYSFYPVKAGMWVGHSNGASFFNYADKSWTHLAKGEAGKGIASGITTAITVDNKGRTWFGTSSGLTVYDGKEYKYYDLLSEKEKQDKRYPLYVNALLFDGSNTWVGTSGALFRFDKDDQITRWDDKLEGLLSIFAPSVYAFGLDDKGNILVAIDKRLVSYDGKAFQDVVEATSTIRSILVTPTGEIWLGLDSSGVYHYDGSEWKEMTAADGLPSNHFPRQGILLDDKGTLWFAAARGGLAHYTP